MKKFTRKLFISIMTLVLTAVALGTSTFAWFSMNQKVTVTGMEVTTQVSNYLLIQEDTLGSTTRIADENFVSSVNSSITALLEPVSTINGKNFFYTINGKADGDAESDSYSAYNAAEVPTTTELTNFNTAYNTGTQQDPTRAVGYVDYVFQLKAVNADTAAHDIKFTKLDLEYQLVGATDLNKAFRVAVFLEDLGETGTAPAGGSASLVCIYAPSTAANQEANKAIGATNAAPAALSKNYNDNTDIAKLATVAAGKTNYYKVVVRLWIEGEDKTCTNTTFAALNNSWKFDLELAIDTATVTNTAVTALTMKVKTN